MRLNLAVGPCSVGALPLAQEHAGSRIEALSERLEVFLPNVALQSEQFCCRARTNGPLLAHLLHSSRYVPGAGPNNPFHPPWPES